MFVKISVKHLLENIFHTVMKKMKLFLNISLPCPILGCRFGVLAKYLMIALMN